LDQAEHLIRNDLGIDPLGNDTGDKCLDIASLGKFQCFFVLAKAFHIPPNPYFIGYQLFTFAIH